MTNGPVSSEIEIAVFEAVRKVAPGCRGPLTTDTPLGVGGIGLDSIGFFELVLEVERRTNARLRDESLMAAALATPGSLVRHIEKLLSADCAG